jgi:ATP-dependent helicase/nuclease subunit A
VKGAGPKHWPSEAIYNEFRDSCAGLRKDCESLLGCLAIDPAAALVAAKAGLALLKLVAEIDADYDAAKSDQGVLDFDDLLIRARRLLTEQESVRTALAAQNRMLLVDECQDTDCVQVEVIKALCGDKGDGNLFFVGDYKQSIYRFRGADPQVFHELREQTPEGGRLGLTENFRSQPGILDFVNALFCEELGRTGEYEPLTAHRKQLHKGPSVEFLWALPEARPLAEVRSGDEENNGEAQRTLSDEGKDADSRRRREADWIARRIRRLLDGELDADETPLLIAQDEMPPRRVQAGDIAILFRALSNVQFYEEALRSYGIDYYLVGGHAFYAQQEIYDLLNLLRTLDCPADEISLAGVLRSPFFSLTDETLFWLADDAGGLSAGFGRAQLPREIDTDQQARLQFARQIVSELRNKKDRMPVAALINEAIALTGYDAALVADFLGERKLANLRKLIEQARAIDRAGVMALSDFIVQLSEFVARQPKESLAATQPEVSNVVRLMTIHQAKGLEFPVVIVPDVGWTMQGGQDAVAFDPDLGPLVKLPKDHPQAAALCGFRLHEALCGDEEAEEEIRKLYVATTRAADYLILASSLQGFEKVSGPWLELLAARFDLQSGRLAAKLPKGYGAPRVRVIGRQPATSMKPRLPYTRVDVGKVVDEIESLAASRRALSTPLVEAARVDHADRRRFSISRLSGFVTSPAWTFAPETDDGSSAGVDPLGLGSLVHAVLANVSLKEPSDLPGLVELHAEKQGVWAQADREEAFAMVERFMRSARAKQLATAPRVLREVEFLLAWPLDAGDESRRYLQGYLDCIFRDEAGGWRVVDYKTNRVDKKNRDKLIAAYELQMLAYGLAAEQALGEPPAELVLHFLRDASEHVIPWNDAARLRAIDLVERSIEQACHGVDASQSLAELAIG